MICVQDNCCVEASTCNIFLIRLSRNRLVPAVILKGVCRISPLSSHAWTRQACIEVR